MKLKKVISGGQTGADRTGLEEAKRLGFETGGTAPKGWKVDGGADPSLAEFGLVESHSTDYPSRTRANVRDSDVTLWFGITTSPGYWCTRGAADRQGRSFFVNPNGLQMEYIVNSYEVINIAGNRKRINPDVVRKVRAAFERIEYLQRGGE
jgi:putative molybdenum carrier protein